MSWLPLGVALFLLMIDSAIELALITSMVGYLHRSGANEYPFVSDTGDSASILAKPKGLLLNEGHTSNGAAGTALIIVCFGGFLVLWNERRRERRNQTRRPSGLFVAYAIFTVVSWLLTLAALAYTFAVTNQTKGQVIDKAVAVQSEGSEYPLDHWTPENWTKALLALPLTSNTDINYLHGWLRVIEGWKWNLILLFLLGLLVASLTVRECLRER
ncbi:hypothetical protein N431DRAFT_310995, partial [Stipitochalara longipes BDJ]